MLTIAENAGHDPLDIELEISKKETNPEYGIDIDTGDMTNMIVKGVVEPLRVVKQAIQSATEVAIAILRIDDIIGKRGEDTGQTA